MKDLDAARAALNKARLHLSDAQQAGVDAPLVDDLLEHLAEDVLRLAQLSDRIRD